MHLSSAGNWIADLIETAVQRGDKHYVRALREREHSESAYGFQFWLGSPGTFAMRGLQSSGADVV